tara:strand:- start:46172 stop:47788 length:1617 start_codon:yes stop_codon:yes gene_type:complete
MATITIDEQQYTVEEGRNLIDAVSELGIDIPHFCYHPGLAPDGNCRMCLTEMEIRPGQFGIVTSCTIRIKDGMNFRFNSPAVLDNRKGVMEFLLINHPLDCPWCDQAGECKLQDNSFDHGRSQSRFVETKRVPPKKELGPHIKLFTTRCILCQRCTRFCDEITGTSELGVVQMGSKSEISTFEGVPLDNKMSANVADICPVGALVTNDFLYKPRIWNYEKVNTVCPGCATGCNTTVEVMDQKIYRTRPRHNEDVNDYWMCDEGRFCYNDWQDLDRLQSPMKRVGEELCQVTWPDAMEFVIEGIKRVLNKNKGTTMGVVGSTMATNEENYLLQKLASMAFKTSRIGLIKNANGESWTAKSGFHIDGDKSPNSQGATDMLGVDSMDNILKGIDDGSIIGLYVLGGNPKLDITDELREKFKKLEFLVVHDVSQTNLAEIADIVFPTTIPFEKTGSMTNSQGRVQLLNPAFPQPGSARDDIIVLKSVGERLGIDIGSTNPDIIFEEIGAKVEEYTGLTYSMIGEKGAIKGNVDTSINNVGGE